MRCARRLQAPARGRAAPGSTPRAKAFTGVSLSGDFGGPTPVSEIPIDRLLNAGVEILTWGPAQFAPGLGAVYGVPTVVAGSVGDMIDLQRVRLAIRPRGLPVEQGTNPRNNLDVCALVEAPNIVGFTQASPRQC